MKSLKILIPAIFIFISCASDKQAEDRNKESANSQQSDSDIITAQFENKKLLSLQDKEEERFELDSSQLKWTDSYVPFVIDNDRLYSATLYSTQPTVNNFKIFALRTNADHWNRLHLVTINEKNSIVDNVLIAEDWEDLLNQTDDSEVVGRQYKFTKMKSSNEYIKTSINSTETINYDSDSSIFEMDSITSKVEITKNGKFKETLMDSIRKTKTILTE